MDVESLALAPPLEQALRQVTPHNRLLDAGLPWGLPDGVEAELSSIYPLRHHHWGSGAWAQGHHRHVGLAAWSVVGFVGISPLPFAHSPWEGLNPKRGRSGSGIPLRWSPAMPDPETQLKVSPNQCWKRPSLGAP